MRRSKSNPAKYARNYRRISQRRMTLGQEEGDDDEAEMARLRSILQNSQSHLMTAGSTPTASKTTEDNDEEAALACGKKSKKRARPTDDSHDDVETTATSILSKEIQEELGGITGDENPLVVLSKKKKKRPKASHLRVELTPYEIKEAKLLQKNTERKLKQLADRSAQKKRRQELYSKLESSAISSEEMKLLSSSSTLGKKETKRETLRRLLQRERAGIKLTQEENDILYQDVGRPTVNDTNNDDPFQPSALAAGEAKSESTPQNDSIASTQDNEPKQQRQRRKKKRKQNAEASALVHGDEKTDGTKAVSTEHSVPDEDTGSDRAADSLTPVTEAPEMDEAPASEAVAVESSISTTGVSVDFAAQMMASLTSLKTKSDGQKEESIQKEREEREEKDRLELEEEQKRKRSRYVPTNPAVLKMASGIGLEQKSPSLKNRRVLPIERPQAVQETRYDLPVSGMEFEIVDAVRNNDVVILCSETGSGKSTQVPQFLYEAGLTVNDNNKDDDLIIGITQPRRVAAVSTAKRVCYEMGHGDGQVIQNGAAKRGNLVAYQTRYESAGLGNDTRVKFMTDGILLQEIQSDLLLRKYGAIVLDEAHERNLNTDVLLGLLSVAVPLRRKASMEDGSGIVPLKLIIMSATLRVEDFMENARLFPSQKPRLVTVPGRTYPVTVHHSKITELEEYETVVFNKICKIHRKLPKGGILVFLTGKQEITRMVSRLRQAFGRSSETQSAATKDVSLGDENCAGSSGAPRDLDDDEIDGDFFENREDNDDFDNMEYQSDDDVVDTKLSLSDKEDNTPRRVHILPLYSMLSTEEQAKVFAPVPDDHRLIVVATNIAETSITIPGISYVVDSGRQKCRNHHAGTGVASYDVMWISKAAADQRAGRAGRTGPGHCYRLYSSSMYSRHMNDFALPEVLTRPLEDVVLAMKAMKISNVANFPFPTPPDQSQLDAAVKLLANVGCIDLSNAEQNEGDGDITRLGSAVAKLPLGVRYGKMLLVAAQAGVLDYAIVLVAVLSESSPFDSHSSFERSEMDGEKHDDDSLDVIDSNALEVQKKKELKAQKKRKWMHKGGDILAGMLAVGAYTYAGRGAGGAAEKSACRNFCEKNGLNAVVMHRIQQMRRHLARLAKTRFSGAEGVAARTGGFLNSMPPPNKLQERLLMQAIVSGLLDNVVMLAPPGSITGNHPAFTLRSAYLSCSSNMNEPLLLDRNSVLFSRDSRQLPEWVCFDSIVRKTTKDGRSIINMKNVTPLDPSWLGTLARSSRMLSFGDVLPSPLPSYNSGKDAVLCSVVTKYGSRSWEIPPTQVEMFDALQKNTSSHFLKDDSFRWFARFLLEGKVLGELKEIVTFWNDEPAVITRKTPVKKVALLIAALSSSGVDSAAALQKHWATVNHKFLYKEVQSWTNPKHATAVKHVWMNVVKKNIRLWKTRGTVRE